MIGLTIMNQRLMMYERYNLINFSHFSFNCNKCSLNNFKNSKGKIKMKLFIIYVRNTITLEVNVNNFSAIKFYEKLGFVKVRTIKNYYGNENAFFMIKVL